MRRLFLTLLFIFCSAAWSLPIIKNHGVYKELSPELRDNLRPLYGHVPQDVSRATRIRPMDPNRKLRLALVLPFNNERELDERLELITNPQSEYYQQYMSQEEFYERYAPRHEQVLKIKSFLRKKGLKTKAVADNRLLMHIEGRVSTINAIFNTEIYHYSDPLGQEFYAPAYELQIAKDLDIRSVQGLEDRVKARPYFKIMGAKTKAPQGFSPAQIRSAYGLPNSGGDGQTLALFELDGFNSADITAYEKAFGLPNVPLQTVLVGGADGSAGEGAGEVTLDIELMIAVAPNAAKIIVYEGPNTSSGLLGTYNKIATDNLAKSVSTSWGLYESGSPASLLQSENQIFKQMVAQGQVLYAAAGDSGAYDNDSSLSVDDPASQPYVVAVGGTSLYVNANGSYNHEKTWSSGKGPGQSGGGGGISSIWSIPSWQKGVISNNSLGSQTMRNVPDVALNSDPATGYAIYFDGGWQEFGGTSCAAPLWAAFTALVDAKRAQAGLGNIGFINPSLYTLGQSTNYASLLHDINDNSTNGYYPAVSGFDLATGWGSFIGPTLIPYLVGNNNPPPPPSCIPAVPSLTLSPVSQQGAAGSSLSYNLSLLNNDSASCSAAVFNLQAKLPQGLIGSLANNSLSVAPGSSASTQVSIASNASLPMGSYAFSLSAANSSNASLTSSVSGSYVVSNQSSSELTLSINPQDAVFSYNSNRYAAFMVDLKNNDQGLSNTVNLVLTGPANYRSSFRTGRNGLITYEFLLNRALPPGTYDINISSNYGGNTANAHTRFRVVR